MTYLGQGRIKIKTPPEELTCWECAGDESRKFTSGVKSCPVCERLYFLGRYLNDFGGPENFDKFMEDNGIKAGDAIDHLAIPSLLALHNG